MTEKVVTLNVQPGIQRDGTQLASPRWVDGVWARFQRGLPRKMGGYKGIFLNAAGISRGMLMSAYQGLNYVISGWSDGIQQWVTDTDDGVGSGPTSYTLSGFSANPNNLWQFDIGFDSAGAGKSLIAHPGQNLEDISSSVATRVLYGTFPGGTLSPVGVFTNTTTLTNGSATFTIVGDVRIGAGQTITSNIGGFVAGTKVLSYTANVVTVDHNFTGANGAATITFDNNIAVSGGCCMLYPYLFVYGDQGLIQNCAAGNFNDWVGADSNANNVATGKIVVGLPVRGGTSSPAGLFWSLDSLIRVSYAPQSAGTYELFWRYDFVSCQTSIMSSQCVVEYDGLFFWMGVDRFLVYNGVVQEVPNQINQNWIFDNLNYRYRQKVWATKVPRYGEIWWFYPRGAATECTDAIVYNIREQTWYDAGQALGARRSAGCFSEVFRKPVWAGWELNSTPGYTLWQHETGVDSIYLNQVNAVQSYVETNNLGWVTGGPGQNEPIGPNKWVSLSRVEPDFVQAGDLNMWVTGKGYADDVDYTTGPYVFSPSTPLKIDMKEQRRELRLRFETNSMGGDYQLGKVLLSIDVGDERGTGNP